MRVIAAALERQECVVAWTVPFGVLSERSGQLARAPEHGRDLRDAALKPVDDAIGRKDDFANRGVLPLRNYSARFRKRMKSLYRDHETPGDQLSVSRGVLRDEGSDRLDVLDRLR